MERRHIYFNVATADSVAPSSEGGTSLMENTSYIENKITGNQRVEYMKTINK